jgi:hypothetical protein
MTLDQIGQLAVTWRDAERQYEAEREPVRVGKLGFGAWRETKKARDAALDALRAAVDEYNAE